MFSAFRPSHVNFSGLLWKVPWKLSSTRKANARARLKKVDAVIEAVRTSGVKCSALVSLPNFCIYMRLILTQDQALELPKEHEMPARDKYTIFSANAKGYRKGIHKVPKWTRVGSQFLSCRTVPDDDPKYTQRTLRTNPKGF
ncbi:54S ribosomal protein L31, mitochondrial [Termitomyces sp. J132]|nr:54S ribosomal protein L31, mitochondrial [Termitomyces sp. J132]